MLVQWLTFAVMTLIQGAAAGIILSSLRTTLEIHSQEIKTLRDWRHAFANKEMVIDQHERRLAMVEKYAHHHGA